jgi:predicted dehydrogenase
MDECWELAAGCFSRDLEQSQRKARYWSIPDAHCYSDWRKFIDQEKSHLDAVAVITPPDSHEEIVCALLEAGLPVICEKPLASTVNQSLNIQRMQQKNAGFLAVCFNYSGYPMVRVLRRHLQAGQLGRINQVHVEMPLDSFIQPKDKMKPQLWRLLDGEIPTILLDLAVHVEHLSSFVLGQRPMSINANFNNFSEFEGIVDDAQMWVRYQEDTRGTFWVSKTALGRRNGLRIRVFGDAGSAEWLQEEPERLHLFDKHSRHVIYDRGNCLYPDEVRERFKPGHPGGFIEAFANLYGDIGSALHEYRKTGGYSSPYVFGWQEAHQGLSLLEAAVKSNAQKQWADIPAILD